MAEYTVARAYGGRWCHDWMKRKSLAAAITYAQRQIATWGRETYLVRTGHKAWLVYPNGVRRVAPDISAERGHGRSYDGVV